MATSGIEPPLPMRATGFPKARSSARSAASTPLSAIGVEAGSTSIATLRAPGHVRAQVASTAVHRALRVRAGRDADRDLRARLRDHDVARAVDRRARRGRARRSRGATTGGRRSVPPPTSSTPSSTPAWRRKSSSGNSAPSHSPSCSPSTATCAGLVVQRGQQPGERQQRVGRGAAELAAVQGAVERAQRDHELAVAAQRLDSVGSPSFQLPLSAMTITSARISSASRSTTSSSRWRPFSSEPSISTLTCTGGLPPYARSAARWAAIPDLSSAAPRPYRRPLLERRRERVGVPALGRRGLDVVVGVEQDGRPRARRSRPAPTAPRRGRRPSHVARRRRAAARRPARRRRRAARAGSRRTRSTGSPPAARGPPGSVGVDLHRGHLTTRVMRRRHTRGVTDVLEGAHIAGCRIEAVAGRGGMGIVYRATQLSLGRPVALKLIAPEHAADAGFRERFQRESRMAAAIDHPNVIPVYEAGEEDGRLYLVMRWVAGTDLHKLLRAEGRLEPLRAALIVNQVAGALDAAHAAGLSTATSSPPTSCSSGEHAYLADFGLTRFAGADTHLTTAGHFLGTVDYMAPEQFHPGPTTRARTSTRWPACCSRRSPARRRSCARRCRRRCSRTCTTRRRGRRNRRRPVGLRSRAGAGAGQGARGPLPVGRRLRPRGAGRGRGPLGHRGGALGGARRGRADDPPRRRAVVGHRRAAAAGPAPAPAPASRRRSAPTARAARRRPWAWVSGASRSRPRRWRSRSSPAAAARRRRASRSPRARCGGWRTRSPPPTPTRTARGSRGC